MIAASRFFCALMLALAAVPPAFAQAPPKAKPASSLDQELLEDLLPLKPVTKPPVPPKPTLPPAGVEGEDIGQPAENPLTRIGQSLQVISRRLNQGDASEATTKLQAGAVADLEALLTQLKKQKPGGGKSPSGGNKSSSGQAGTEAGAASLRPGADSTQRLEKGRTEQVEIADVKDALRRAWGHLPEKEREQMLTALGETFLPKYEKLIESFYRKLAEEPARAP